MAEYFAFSVETPRVGMSIEVVEWGGSRIRPSGELIEVSGPFCIGSHDQYECKTASCDRIQIVHLQAGERMDWEEDYVYDLLGSDPSAGGRASGLVR